MWSAWSFSNDFRFGPLRFNVCMFVFWSMYFIVAWCFSCANAQTYILVENERRIHIRARTANLIFLGGLAVGTAVMLVSHGLG